MSPRTFNKWVYYYYQFNTSRFHLSVICDKMVILFISILRLNLLFLKIKVINSCVNLKNLTCHFIESPVPLKKESARSLVMALWAPVPIYFETSSIIQG